MSALVVGWLCVGTHKQLVVEEYSHLIVLVVLALLLVYKLLVYGCR